MSKGKNNSRTSWAEVELDRFLSMSFIREFVFRSPQLIDKTQKELADMLLAHSDYGILIQQKCQEDPSKRSLDKAASWAQKKAKEGLNQLIGALKKGKSTSFWCEHSRRGRVEFHNGLPPLNHGIVLVEVLSHVDLKPLENGLPLQYDGIPISYFSLNDFMNIAINLRSLPELIEYLDARLILPSEDRRSLGNERRLFEAYVLNDGHFPSDITIAKAEQLVQNNQDKLILQLMAHSNLVESSKFLEYVADKLAERHPAYAEGLSNAVLAAYDNDDSRSNYLILQEAIADLRLSWRGGLGAAFLDLIEKMNANECGLIYQVGFLDPKPDWIFVLGCSKNEKRVELIEQRIPALTVGALAFFRKTKAMTIIDRDSESFEVQYVGMQEPPTTDEAIAIGKHLFGHLNIESKKLRTLR